MLPSADVLGFVGYAALVFMTGFAAGKTVAWIRGIGSAA